jgi:protein-tyrosine phosphatase
VSEGPEAGSGSFAGGEDRQLRTGAALGLPSLPNLRDLGGHRTRDGRRVRIGLVYRSADLTRLTDGEAAALAGLGLRSIYDLRTEEERASWPDRMPPGASYVAVDVLSSSGEATPSELMRLFADAASAREILGGERGFELWERKYREFVRLESARAAYGRLFGDLADGGHLPALFHCTTGKDRTGWAAAALLLLLGVPERVVVDEYLLSARYLEDVMRPALDAFRARGGDPALLAPVIAVRREYLDAALAEMRASYGSIEEYFSAGLGLDAAAQDRLRAILVERA